MEREAEESFGHLKINLEIKVVGGVVPGWLSW